MISVNVIYTVVCLLAAIPLAFLADEAGMRMVKYKCAQYEREVPAKWTKILFFPVKGLWYLILAAALTGAMLTNGITGLLLTGIFAFVGIMIGITDFYCRLIPNELLLVLLPFTIIYAVLYVILPGNPWWYIPVSLLAVFVVMQGPNLLLRTKKVVGAGDVKLWFLVAIALGGPRMILALLIFSVAFIIYMLIGMQLNVVTLKSYFPMGGFISAGLVFGSIWTLEQFCQAFLS